MACEWSDDRGEPHGSSGKNNHAEPTPAYLQWYADSYRWLVVECVRQGTAVHTANGLALQELPPITDGDSMVLPC
eukprot:5002682-Amphidinium_carterae.1